MGKEALFKHLPVGEEGDYVGRVMIPKIDGGMYLSSHDGVRVHLQNIEALQNSKEQQQIKQQIQALYKDDSLVANKSGRQPSLMQRPKSLAVPELTAVSTGLQEPQGPVMSISPQATYLSTIIPNAILPSSIDVIEIDRSCNGRSGCTVNKNSLTSASPGSSCSERDIFEPPFTTSKRGSSQSSDTIVSNPSTISFKGCEAPANSVNKMMDIADLNEERLSLKSSASWSSSASKTGRQRPGELSNAIVTIANNQLCSRNLSIIKNKLPPAPPPRTTCFSHHESPKISVNTPDVKYSGINEGQNDELTGKEDSSIYNENISTSYPVLSEEAHLLTNSPGSPVQKSTYAKTSPNGSSPENTFERTVSPSSGYSSQSGTPTHTSKDICPLSPRRIKSKPPKPERISIRVAPAVSVSSLASMTATISDPVSNCIQTTAHQQSTVSLTVTTKVVVPPTSIATAFRELFDIPPAPKVKAPSPPPPETWAHNKRTTELLFGSNVYVHRAHELQKPSEKDFLKEKNLNTTDSIGERQAIGVIDQLDELIPKDKINLDITFLNPLIQNQNQHEQQLEQKITVTQFTLDGNNNQKLQSPKKQMESKLCPDGANVLLENNTFTPKVEGAYTNDKYLISQYTDIDIPNQMPIQTVNIESPNSIELSPSFLPPSKPSSQEEELLSEKTTELSILESSWPPPPPPMDESADLVFEGQVETDFPLPPPPVVQESFLEIHDNCNLHTYVSDMVSNLEQNPQIINSTTICKESTPKISGISEFKLHNQSNVKSKSTEGVSQAAIDAFCVLPKTSTFQNRDFYISSQKVTFEPQNNTSNPLIETDNDFLQQSMTELVAGSSDGSPSCDLSSEDQVTNNFRVQSNSTSKDNTIQELLPNYKSAPNEDANIPLVKPSLLSQDQDQCVSNVVTPQKPVRKSIQLSIKSSPMISTPSMCLQQAIRMKTAAMSSSGLSTRPNICSLTPTTNNNRDSVTTHKTPNDSDLHKSPASTASFIFSKSTKKVVLETPTSPETHTGLKQSLAAELKHVTDQTKSVLTNRTKKPVKIPPPIAKKPVCATILSEKSGTVTLKMESKQENGAQSTGNQMLAGKKVNPISLFTIINKFE